MVKVELRAELERLQKELNILRNQQMMHRADRAIGAAVRDVQQRIIKQQLMGVKEGGEGESSGGSRPITAVLSVAVGSDSKAIKRAVEEIKRAAPGLSFLCLSREPQDASTTAAASGGEGIASAGASGDSGKLTVFCFVSDAAQRSRDEGGLGLKANEWLSAALGAVGGRGGGKAGLAQGSVASATRLVETELKAAAEQYCTNCSSRAV